MEVCCSFNVRMGNNRLEAAARQIGYPLRSTDRASAHLGTETLASHLVECGVARLNFLGKPLASALGESREDRSRVIRAEKKPDDLASG